MMFKVLCVGVLAVLAASRAAVEEQQQQQQPQQPQYQQDELLTSASEQELVAEESVLSADRIDSFFQHVVGGTRRFPGRPPRRPLPPLPRLRYKI